MALPVAVEGIAQFDKGDFLLVEHEFLHGHQGVHGGSEARLQKRCGIDVATVEGTVQPAFDAERNRRAEDVGGIDVRDVLLEVVGDVDDGVDAPFEVGEIAAVEVVEGTDVLQFHQLVAHGGFRAGIEAVVENPFKRLEHVDVAAAGSVGVVSAGRGEFVTTAHEAVSGVFIRRAHGFHDAAHALFAAEDEAAVPFSDHAEGGVDEFVRRRFGDFQLDFRRGDRELVEFF